MLLIRLMALPRFKQHQQVTRIDDGQREIRLRSCWKSGPIVRTKRAADGNPPDFACQSNHGGNSISGIGGRCL
jgi:hypothetical protein